MMLLHRLAWRSKRNRATPSTASRMTLNNKSKPESKGQHHPREHRPIARPPSVAVPRHSHDFIRRPKCALAQCGIMQQQTMFEVLQPIPLHSL